jgi:hypothetical protein
MNIEQSLAEVCEKHRIPACHSDFQISNFIIGKETSLVGKQWQCLREIQARKENLELLKYEMEEVEDNIELANLDLQKFEYKLLNLDENDYKHKKLKIYIRKQQRKIKKLNAGKITLLQKKDDLEKESKMFLEIFQVLIKENGFAEFNDPNYQFEYWNKKFETEVNMCQFLGTPISGELIKSIMALPEISRIRKNVLDALTNANKKLSQKSN